MGTEGLAGGWCQCSGPFWRLGGIGRSCGARRADRHFTSRREGGGSCGDGFLQGKETRPREEGAEAQISCRRGLAGGARARERGLRPIKGLPRRSFPNVPRTPPRSLLGHGAAVCAPGRLMRFIHARLCSALLAVGTARAQECLLLCFPPHPFLPSRSSVSSVCAPGQQTASRSRARTSKDLLAASDFPLLPPGKD